MDLILLEPGNGELVFGKAPDGDKGGGIDATWRDAAALRGMAAAQPTRLHIARHADSKTANVITIALRNAMISEFQLQTHADDMPTEQFKLNFTEILWGHSVQQADGEDAGPGIAKQLAPHVFEAFRRGDSDGGDPHAGSGLGLAVVEAIARAHGGSAACTRGKAGGSVFTVKWPVEHGALPAA